MIDITNIGFWELSPKFLADAVEAHDVELGLFVIVALDCITVKMGPEEVLPAIERVLGALAFKQKALTNICNSGV